MCDRVTLNAPDQLALRVEAAQEASTPRLDASYNIAPARRLPVVIEEADGRHVRLVRRGPYLLSAPRRRRARYCAPRRCSSTRPTSPP